MSTQVSARKIGKLSAIYMIGSFAPQVIGLLLTPIFTRYLEPAEMGIVNQAMNLGLPLTLVVPLGFFGATKGEYFRVEPERRPSLVRTTLVGQSVVAAIICTILLMVGLIPISDQRVADFLLPNLPLTSWQVYFVFALVIWQAFCDSVVNLCCGVAQLNERAAATVAVYITRYLTQAALGLVAVIGLGWLGLGRQITVTAGVMIAAVCSLFIGLPHARGKFEWELFRRTFWSGLTFVPHILAAFIPQTVTSWLIGFNLGTHGNGLFGAALQLPKMTEVTMNAVGSASYPTLAGLMRDSDPGSKRQQSRVYTLLVIAATGISLCVAVLSPIGIRILYDRAYHEAIDYAPVLALAWLFTGLFLIVSQPVFFVGGGKWLSSASITAAITHLAISVPAIAHFGLWGASWSLVVGNAVLFVVAAFAGQRVYPLPWEYSKIAAILGAALSIGLLDVYLCTSLNWIVSIPIKIGLLVAWLVLLRATGALSAAEISRAWAWFREKGRLYRRAR